MMDAFLLFNFKIALSLSAVAVFYKLFLSTNTLFRQNRYFLLAGIMVSVIVCCVALDEHITDKVTKASAAIFPVSMQPHTYGVETVKSIPIDLWSIIFIIWLIGFVFQLLRCSVQFLSLKKIRQDAAEKKIGDRTVYITPQNIAPFSFGQSIFLPQSCIASPELNQILSHEKIHVQQWHTIDMVLAELCCCFVWYNPLVYQLKKWIRHNLEFLTDAEMIESGVDRQAYQYLLLRFSSAYSLPIGNPLNNNFLKNRVKMINQERTRRIKGVVYLFFIPLTLCLSLSFTFLSSQGTSGVNTRYSVDTTTLDYIDHIEIYGETGKGDTAYIHYKNGHVEKIFLKGRKDNIRFQRKYAPVLPQYQLMPESKITQPESVNTVPEEASQFTMNDEYIWLTLPDGSKEEYKLGDPAQKSAFERKYGKRAVKRK